MIAEISVITLLKQIGIALPSIILGTQNVTAAIKGLFDIKDMKLNKIISWVIAVLIAVGFVAFNGLTFVTTPVWLNYALGVVSGVLAGAAANGIYQWEAVWKIFNAITEAFAKTRKSKQ